MGASFHGFAGVYGKVGAGDRVLGSRANEVTQRPQKHKLEHCEVATTQEVCAVSVARSAFFATDNSEHNLRFCAARKIP